MFTPIAKTLFIGDKTEIGKALLINAPSFKAVILIMPSTIESASHMEHIYFSMMLGHICKEHLKGWDTGALWFTQREIGSFKLFQKVELTKTGGAVLTRIRELPTMVQRFLDNYKERKQQQQAMGI